MSDVFVFYKVYGSLTVEIFCVRYVPLLVIALVCIFLAFTTNGHAGRAAIKIKIKKNRSACALRFFLS